MVSVTGYELKVYAKSGTVLYPPPEIDGVFVAARHHDRSAFSPVFHDS